MADHDSELRRRFIRDLLAWGGCAAFGSLPLRALAAAQVKVTALRYAGAADRARIVLDLEAPVEHRVFTLRAPDRLVVDVSDAKLVARSPATESSALVERIRHGVRNGSDLRIVLDLRGEVQPKTFLLPPDGEQGHRLVVDLARRGEAQPGEQRPAAPEPPVELRDVVVAIDAGHGGSDPGALGRNGTREKDVTLQVARRLNQLLKRERGIKPVMIRKNDQRISLRDRMRMARDSRADLLVSIHADAFRDPRAKGASVYALSLRGASSEAAKWLADRENAVDLIGGVSLDDKDDVVASVLLDLSQTATIQSSLAIGDRLLDSLDRVAKLHKREVQQAGFTVLRSPDIPSVLVETAFISNPAEENKLRTTAYQRSLARALRDGIRDYYSKKAPPGTVLYADGSRRLS